MAHESHPGVLSHHRPLSRQKAEGEESWVQEKKKKTWNEFKYSRSDTKEDKVEYFELGRPKIEIMIKTRLGFLFLLFFA